MPVFVSTAAPPLGPLGASTRALRMQSRCHLDLYPETIFLSISYGSSSLLLPIPTRAFCPACRRWGDQNAAWEEPPLRPLHRSDPGEPHPPPPQQTQKRLRARDRPPHDSRM